MGKLTVRAWLASRVSGDLEANVGEPLRLAAIGGRGLVQLATYVVRPDIATGSLVTALDAYEPDAIPIHALYLDRRHLSAAVRSFVEFLQTRFQIPASWDPGKQLARIGFAP